MKSLRGLYPKGSKEADELLRVTKEKGQDFGMRYAGIKSFVPFRNLLEYLTGDRDYGLIPESPQTHRRADYFLTVQGLADTDRLIATKYHLMGIIRKDIEELEKERRLKLFQLEELGKQGEPHVLISEVIDA